MTIPEAATAIHDQMLSEIAGLAMDLARDFAGRAKAAETVADAERLALSFERMARSVRLSIALQRRLHRDLRADRAEAVEVRRKQVRAALIPAIHATTRRLSERFERESELDVALAEEAFHEAFVQTPLASCIARLRDRLGLPAEDAANDASEALSPRARAGPS